MDSENIEKYVNRAEELFHQGFNCSQSVFAACAPALYGIDEEMALRISASFGGGIGRMRSICGAASGMFLLEGLRSGSSVQGDHEGKMQNYQQVQRLATSFETECGSLICSELLGLQEKGSGVMLKKDSPEPSPRTEAYYHKRPCVEMVKMAVRIFLTQE